MSILNILAVMNIGHVSAQNMQNCLNGGVPSESGGCECINMHSGFNCEHKILLLNNTNSRSDSPTTTTTYDMSTTSTYYMSTTSSYYMSSNYQTFESSISQLDDKYTSGILKHTLNIILSLTCLIILIL